MNYIVLDEKGLAYSDNAGRKVIECGGILPQSLIDKNYFTLAGVESLIKNGRLKAEGKQVEKKEIIDEKEPIQSPSNKMAEIPKKKKRSKK
ncbi:MAG: hypothetical protein KKG92_15465 [Gammaproteobacteria bacterium]|nr:hypothetical protein [Gammaproteobacteria bacterium]